VIPILGAVLAVVCTLPAAAADLTVASKKFTESVILGEIVAAVARSGRIDTEHRRELGGTRVLWEALRRGDVDAYPEYTGTISHELLRGHDTGTPAKMKAALAREGIEMAGPLGFNNTYALALRAPVARRLGVASISDLKSHPALAIGVSNEFLDRRDGWPGLRDRYGLPQRIVRGLDHDLAYRGLAAGSIDVTDVYTTDAEISYYGLVVLRDDRGYFPVYNAVVLYRSDVKRRYPAFASALERLGGAIDEGAMSRMNARAKIDREPETAIAAAFVSERFGAVAPVARASLSGRVLSTTLDHLTLVAISLSAAIAISVPLGIVAARRRLAGQIALGIAAVLQTIPSLALFVFMIPLLGIGGPPALVALFLYSLLPIVRNTHAGLTGIDPALVESAEALGLEPLARLRIVELPLAAPSILAGIKTAAVINVGTATLGALIGAGGYGQPILTGIRLDDIGLILEGAVPAALLALAVQGLFELAERGVVPRGLRLPSTR
jgi:osmoprotectant transport system permease protein